MVIVVVGSRCQVRKSVDGWKGGSSGTFGSVGWVAGEVAGPDGYGSDLASSAARSRPAARAASDEARNARRLERGIGNSPVAKVTYSSAINCRKRPSHRYRQRPPTHQLSPES